MYVEHQLFPGEERTSEGEKAKNERYSHLVLALLNWIHMGKGEGMKNPEDLFIQVLIKKNPLQKERKLHSNTASLLVPILFLDQNPSKSARRSEQAEILVLSHFLDRWWDKPVIYLETLGAAAAAAFCLITSERERRMWQLRGVGRSKKYHRANIDKQKVRRTRCSDVLEILLDRSDM